jgi:hypothetical protein
LSYNKSEEEPFQVQRDNSFGNSLPYCPQTDQVANAALTVSRKISAQFMALHVLGPCAVDSASQPKTYWVELGVWPLHDGISIHPQFPPVPYTVFPSMLVSPARPYPPDF